MKTMIQWVQWILRIGIFLTFAGHGILAWQVNPEWVKYLTVWGMTESFSRALMPFIGILDLIVALLILLRPFQGVLVWCFIWAFATALVRPIAGDSVLAFVERGANWAAPLALLLLRLKED